MSTLAFFAATLAALDPDLPVQMNGASGLGVVSWRGDYCEPSIDHGPSNLAAEWAVNTEFGFSFNEPTKDLRFDPAETVGELLAVVEAVRGGAGLNGYKGGVYTAEESSTVWADPYGDYNSRIILGVSVDDGVANLAVSEPMS